MKLKDLQKDEFAKTVIKRSSGTDRHLYLLRVKNRLVKEIDRLEAVGEKIAYDLVQSGKGFDHNDPRSTSPQHILVGRVEDWKSIYAMPDEIPSNLVTLCRLRNRRWMYLKRQLAQVNRYLKGIQAAQTRKEREDNRRRLAFSSGVY